MKPDPFTAPLPFTSPFVRPRTPFTRPPGRPCPFVKPFVRPRPFTSPFVRPTPLTSPFVRPVGRGGVGGNPFVRPRRARRFSVTNSRSRHGVARNDAASQPEPYRNDANDEQHAANRGGGNVLRTERLVRGADPSNA